MIVSIESSPFPFRTGSDVFPQGSAADITSNFLVAGNTYTPQIFPLLFSPSRSLMMVWSFWDWGIICFCTASISHLRGGVRVGGREFSSGKECSSGVFFVWLLVVEGGSYESITSLSVADNRNYIHPNNSKKY